MSEEKAGSQGSGTVLQKSCESTDLVKKCKHAELRATNGWSQGVASKQGLSLLL